MIEVGASYTCNTTVVSTQPQFEAAEMVVTFAATAAPRYGRPRCDRAAPHLAHLHAHPIISRHALYRLSWHAPHHPEGFRPLNMIKQGMATHELPHLRV